jgi:hypothetical protein
LGAIYSCAAEPEKLRVKEGAAKMATLKSTALAVGVSVVLITNAIVVPSVIAGEYSFTKVADSTIDDFDPSSTGAPAISDLGHVAFSTRSADGTVSRVLRSAPGLGGPLTLIGDDSINTDIASFSDSVSVNSSGEVAVWATISGPVFERILRGDGGALVPIAEASSGEMFNFMSVVVSVNDAGLVVWQGELNQTGFPQGLWTGDGGPVNTIFNTASSSFTSSFAGPAINNGGQIAFRASTNTSHGDAIFRYDGGSVFTTIVDSSGPFSAVFDQEPAINNVGTVAVIGRSDNLSTQYLIVGDGAAPATPIVSTSGPLASINGAAINDTNQIAFAATFDDFSTLGIFGGPDLINDRVIRSGDALDDSTVSSLSMDREGLNNSGQIAFFAQLADGRGVIMVASPAAAPCPGDVNGDRVVDLSDLAILLAHFGTLSGATLADGDLDGDGDVDLADLAQLLGSFGTNCV